MYGMNWHFESNRRNVWHQNLKNITSYLEDISASLLKKLRKISIKSQFSIKSPASVILIILMM